MLKHKATFLITIFFLLLGLAGASAQAFFPTRVKGTAQVRFTSNAPGVQVAIDGQAAGTIPLTVFVTLGAHRFSFTAPGEETKTITYPVKADVDVPFQVTQKTYPLTINTNVPGATLSMDGAVFSGNSIAIGAGAHTLMVSAPGYQTASVPFTQPASPNTLNVTLVAGAFPLTVNTNVPGATLSIDGTAFIGNSISIAAGPHTLTVSALGYQTATIPFTQPSSPNTLNITLNSSAFPLTVNTNVPNAALSMDGTPFAGKSLSVTAGAHTLTVTAPGYQTMSIPFTQPSSPNTLNVTLIASTFPLTVNTNVPGASLAIDGNVFAGNTINVTAGAHTLSVTAPNYQPLSLTFQQPSQANTMNVTLIAVPATLTLNTDGLFRAGTPYKLFVNNAETRGPVLTLSPGSYLIRIVSDSVSVETTIALATAQSLTLAPSIVWNIR